MVLLLTGACAAQATDTPADSVPSFNAFPLLADAATKPTTSTTAPSTDKSAYTLFNPTPPSLMRPMTEDRPQATDSPYSVDAGHLQIEDDVFDYTHQYSSYDFLGDQIHERTDIITLFNTGIRAGLTNYADLEVDVAPYENLLQTFDDNEFHDRNEFRVGVDRPTTIRSTINLWGNDGGRTAGAIIPFIVLPTGDRAFSFDRTEGGLQFPVQVALSHGFDVIAEPGLEIVRNLTNTHYGHAFFSSIGLEHDLFSPKVKGFIEYSATSPVALGRIFTSSADVGGRFIVNRNLELHAAVYKPVTDRYTSVTVETGLAFRF